MGVPAVAPRSLELYPGRGDEGANPDRGITRPSAAFPMVRAAAAKWGHLAAPRRPHRLSSSGQPRPHLTQYALRASVAALRSRLPGRVVGEHHHSLAVPSDLAGEVDTGTDQTLRVWGDHLCVTGKAPGGLFENMQATQLCEAGATPCYKFFDLPRIDRRAHPMKRSEKPIVEMTSRMTATSGIDRASCPSLPRRRPNYYDLGVEHRTPPRQ